MGFNSEFKGLTGKHQIRIQVYNHLYLLCPLFSSASSATCYPELFSVAYNSYSRKTLI